MTDKTLQTILSNTYTTDAVARRMRLLRQYVESKVFTVGKKITLETFLKENGAEKQDIQSMQSWGKSFYDNFTKSTLEKTIKILSDNIESLKTITVFVPVELEEKETANVGKWFRDNINSSLLVDVRYEPNLSAGCSLVYKGLYGDFSLKYYLRNKRDEIVKIISSYKNENKNNLENAHQAI